MLGYYRQRPRFTLIMVCVPIVVLTLVFLHIHRDTAMRFVGKAPPMSVDDGDIYGMLPAKDDKDTEIVAADAVPATRIEHKIESYLSKTWDAFNDWDHEFKYGLKVGNYTMDKYMNELHAVYSDFLTGGDNSYPWLEAVYSRASFRPTSKPYPPAPDQLITTDKNIYDLPDMFNGWKEKMPQTKLNAFDDRALEKWVEYHFGGTELHAIWRRLPRIVLKSDLFRYLVLLVEGGIYADSDTSPIIPADKWGRPYDVGTPEKLQDLTSVLGLMNSPDGQPVDGDETGEPGLVVGIEFDAIMYGWNWHDIGVSRAVQITQWVMQARPGHPILLDVVGRVLRQTLQIEQDEAAAKAKGEEYIEPWALEWTGPGVWTDCVYRYLLVRYGITPEALISMKRPTRYGDVLFLPSKTFAAAWPNEQGVPEKDFDAVIHGFKGRWRPDDPTVQEINRLKQEEEERKKKEEEAKKKEEEAKAAEGKQE